jgi:hypothetical protein
MNRFVKIILFSIGLVIIIAAGFGFTRLIGLESEPQQKIDQPGEDLSSPTSLKPPDAASPAAGICARESNSLDLVVVTFQIDNVPSPRCTRVLAHQYLSVKNNTNSEIKVRLAQFVLHIKPGDSQTIDVPFGDYLAPGVHILEGLGGAIWLVPAP